MREQRAEQRNLCSDIVELFWKDRMGWPQRAKAILEDITATGACIQTEVKMPVDTELELRLGGREFPGRIRYCTLIGGSYFAGVEFAAGLGWLDGSPEPRHLLRWPPGAAA